MWLIACATVRETHFIWKNPIHELANWALEKSYLLILSSHLLSQTSNVLLQVWTCWSSSTSTNYIHSVESTYAFRIRYNVRNFQQLPHQNLVQVILFEINCAIFYTDYIDLHELFSMAFSVVEFSRQGYKIRKVFG